jgi:hypothetical protein
LLHVGSGNARNIIVEVANYFCFFHIILQSQLVTYFV